MGGALLCLRQTRVVVFLLCACIGLHRGACQGALGQGPPHGEGWWAVRGPAGAGGAGGLGVKHLQGWKFWKVKSIGKVNCKIHTTEIVCVWGYFFRFKTFFNPSKTTCKIEVFQKSRSGCFNVCPLKNIIPLTEHLGPEGGNDPST